MKLKLEFVDELLVDVELDRRGTWAWTMRGIFVRLKYRDHVPHVSIFSEPNTNGKLTPHFTAYGSDSRRTLAKVTPRALEAGYSRIADNLSRRLVTALQHVTVEELQANDWTVHYLDPRVLGRWMRHTIRARGRLQLGQREMTALALHVLRHVEPMQMPERTGQFASDNSVPLIAVRFGDDADDVELRPLLYYPEGIPSDAFPGLLAEDGPPGWYWLKPDWLLPEDMIEATASDRIEKILRKAQDLFARFPRNGGPTAPWDPDMPKWISFMVGHFGDLLWRIAIYESIKWAESSAT